MRPPPRVQAPPSTLELFWRRWEQYRPALFQQCLRLLGGDKADAEEAMSITLLSATQQFTHASPSIRDERAWLKRILFNACMDVHRYRKRFISPGTHAEHPHAEEPEPASGDTEVSAEEVLLAQERSRELQDHIQALPASLRVPLIMRFYRDMSYPEIAEELKLTNCNVRKRVQLAYSQLRTALSLGREVPALEVRRTDDGEGHEAEAAPA